MPVLLGHHGRGKILSWTWRYPATAVVTSLHGRGDLTISALNMNYERGIEEVCLLLLGINQGERR